MDVSRLGHHAAPDPVLPALAVILAVLAIGTARLHGPPHPGSRRSPARLVQPGPPRWRSMRLLWRRPVSPNDVMGQRVTDMQLLGGRLYYVGESEVGCVAADTGGVLWTQSLVPPGVRE